jgi:anti-sigma factor RsiW
MRSGERTLPVSEAELHEYVDGELDRERENAVRAYLSVSPVDSARVENWRRQNEALRATFPPLDAGQRPWPPPGNARECGYRRSHERWISYPVALAFVLGALLSGSVVFIAVRLNWL